LKTQNQDLFI